MSAVSPTAIDDVLALPIMRTGLVAHRVQPRAPGRFVELPPEVHSQVAAALRRQGITRLYSHQAEAFTAVRSGRDVVVVTPTSSGKTLCYNLPVLDHLARDPNARALYLFPTKALAQDQADELYGLINGLEVASSSLASPSPGTPLPPVERGTGSEGTPVPQRGRGAGGQGGLLQIKTHTYDGDTPESARRAVRLAGHIVITNPDMLHTGILPHHTRWHRLFENLRYVVVDELHQYRGVFGSHLANVLRRLARICQHYGSRPQFICCSATIANPVELAEGLTGRDVVAIDRNGAPTGEKHIVLFNPPVVNRQLGIRASSLVSAESIAAELIGRGLQTLLFGRSRVAVEVALTRLREKVRQFRVPGDRIRGYRSGYLPLRRREIEQGLRDGSVRGVVSTNALELGIDVGGLQAVVLAGYPGTIASTWQQIGRAGRRADVSLAVFVASSNPLDQYLVRHPEYLFERSPEHGLINPDNLLIRVSHLKCAAFELPLGDVDLADPTVLELADLLEYERVLHRSAGRYYWSADSYPAQQVSLRSAATENVVIVDTTDLPTVLGEVDRFAAPLLVHEGAIYIHEGQQHQVERLDWENKKAYVRRVDVDYYTDASLAVDLKVLDVFEEVPAPLATHAHGEVRVNFQPTIYKKLKLDTRENVGWGTIYLPEDELHSAGYWLALAPALAERFSPPELESGLLALANALAHVAPLHLMCDPRDIHVFPQVKSPHTQLPTVYLYESMPETVGFGEHLFRVRGELFATAEALIRECGCPQGCPSCVGPVDAVGSTGKDVALQLLAALRETSHPHPNRRS